jgi:hypothetical protein
MPRAGVPLHVSGQMTTDASDVENVFAILHRGGLTKSIIVPESCKIGTSFKSYCRLVINPNLGILFSDEITDDSCEHRRSLDQIIRRLSDEDRYLKELRDLGARVPQVYSHRDGVVVKFTDRRTATPQNAAGMVIQHIEGEGPFKLMYELPRLAKVARAYKVEEPIQKEYERIREIARSRCPRDLQVFMTRECTLVVLDVEQLGMGQRLPDWPLSVD